MTDMQKYDILMPTNPVPTDAPTVKEDHTDMSGAKITALYCRLSQEDERLPIRPSLWTTGTAAPISSGQASRR